MITPTKDLIDAALIDLRAVMDYVASESGDCNILRWLRPVGEKLELVQKRLSNPVVPQED
jgi:hypothetical protein